MKTATKTVGMAIRITEGNREKLALVNEGVVPEVESYFYTGTYFILPYDSDASCSILPGYAFFANYEFTKPENTDCFVEIQEI